MPSRLIPESVLADERICLLSPQAQLLIYKLIGRCDDLWRFDGRPAVIRAMCYPLTVDGVTETDVAGWISEGKRSGALRLYRAGGQEVVQILLFEPYKRGREVTSKWPEPDPDVPRLPLVTDGNQRLPPVTLSGDGFGVGFGVGDGDEGGVGGTDATPPVSDADGADPPSDEAGDGSTDPPDAGRRPRSRTGEKEPPGWAMEIAQFLAEMRAETNPNARAPTAGHLRAWADSIRLLHEKDDRPVELIWQVVRWVRADDRPATAGKRWTGWARVVQSGEALRRDWDKITAEMEARNGHAGQNAGAGGGAGTPPGHTPGMRNAEVERLVERARKRYGIGPDAGAAAADPGEPGIPGPDAGSRRAGSGSEPAAAGSPGS